MTVAQLWALIDTETKKSKSKSRQKATGTGSDLIAMAKMGGR